MFRRRTTGDDLRTVYQKEPHGYISPRIIRAASIDEAYSNFAPTDSPRTRKKLAPNINLDQLILKGNTLAPDNSKTHILLTGAPGSGKSSAATELANSWASIAPTKVKFEDLLLINLKLLANPIWKTYYSETQLNEDFLACFIHYCIKHMPSKHLITTAHKAIELAKIIEVLSSKTAKIFVVDGYDGLNEDQDRIIDEVYRYNDIIITSRFELPILRHHQFQLYLENTGLDDHGVTTYIKARLGEHSALIEFINQNEAIREICKIPLNLDLLCQIWPKDEALRNTDENHSITITHLYETLIYWMGRKYIEDVEKNPLAATKTQIMIHPIVLFMQERAFNSLFDEPNPTLIDKYKTAILERLPSKAAVTGAIDQFGLLKVDFGRNRDELDYVFTHDTFQEFMAARQLRDALMSPEPRDFYNAMKLIALHSSDTKYLMVMKFLSGLITYIPDQSQKELAGNRFWKAIISNNEEVLKIPGDETTKLLMHLLAQTMDSIALGPSAPKVIIDYVDREVAKDIYKWSESLVDSHYVSPSILDLLEPYDRNTRIQAIKILPYLNIEHTSLTEKLITEVRSNSDPEIIEIAIRELGHMSSRPNAYSALLEFASDPRSMVAITATEILGAIANQDALPILLNNLDNSNIWILINTFDALKNYKDLSSTPIITNKLIQKLSYQGPDKKLIIGKCIYILNQLESLNSQLVDRFFTQLDGSKLEATNAINSLVNLVVFDFTIIKKLYDKWSSIPYGARITLKCQIIQAVGSGFNLLPSSDQESYYTTLINKFSIIVQSDPRIKTSAIEALGTISSSLTLDKKITIFDLILKNAASTQYIEEIRIAAINQLSILAKEATHSQQELLYDLVIKNLLETSDIIKDATLSALHCIDANQNIISKHFIEQVNQYFMNMATSDGGNEAAVNILGKIAYMLPANYAQVLSILLEMTGSKTSALKHASIQAIYELISELKSFHDIDATILENIHDIMLSQSKTIETIRRLNSDLAEELRIDTSKMLEEQDHMALLVIGKLANFIPLMKLEHTLTNFLGKISSTKASPYIKTSTITALAKFVDKIPPTRIVEILDLLMSQDTETIIFIAVAKFIGQLKMFNLIPDDMLPAIVTFLTREITDENAQYVQKEVLIGFIDQLRESQKSMILDFMVTKYTNNQNEVTPQEQILQYKACSILLSQATKSYNVITHNRVLSTIKALGYNNDNIIAMISESLSSAGPNAQDQLQILLGYKAIFQENSVIMAEIEQIITIIQSTHNQIPMMEIFEDLAKLTTYSSNSKLDIKITRDEFFINGKLQKLKINPEIAKHIYETLPQESILKAHSLYKKDAHNSIIDRSKLDLNLWKISILNQEGTTEHAVLIMEKQTIFSDATIKKTTVEKGELVTEVYSTMDLDLREIFGDYSEDIRYRVRSFMATEEEHLSLLIYFQEHIDLHPNIYSSRIISHNDLIRHDMYDIRQVIEEFRLELGEVKRDLQLTKQQISGIRESFKSFASNQEHMAKLISAMDSINSVKVNPSLNPYQEKLYVTIVHELMATYMMAITMVYNPGSIIGNVGNFLGAIGSYVPVVGAGVSLLGYILSKVSEVKQTQISNNIANMAIGPVEMEAIAKKIALTIATSHIDVSKLSDNSIYNILVTVLSITSPQDLLGAGISYIMSLDSGDSNTSSIALAQQQGEHDGLLLVDTLISFVSAGNDIMISSDGGAANLKILTEYLVSNAIISDVIETHTSLVVDSAALAIDTAPMMHTPLDVRNLYEKAKQLTTTVFNKCIELKTTNAELEINQKQQTLFVDALARVLVSERHVEDQFTLLDLIDKNSNFKASLISKLADAILDLEAFKVDGIKLTIDRNFLVDAEDLAQAAQTTADYFQGRQITGYNSEVITIEPRVFIGQYFKQPPNTPTSEIGTSPFIIGDLPNPIPLLESSSNKQDSGVTALPNQVPNALHFTANHDMDTTIPIANQVPNTPHPIANHNMEMALTGVAMINYAESKHSLKYLFTHYIPIMPYIKSVTDYLGITEYEHAIDTTIFIGGAVTLAYSASADYTRLILPSITYAVKPYAYQGRDYLLSYIYDQESKAYLGEGIKFTAYVLTDTGLSVIISSPLILVNPTILVHSIIHGAGSGAIHYYNQREHKPNELADKTASAVTTIAIAHLLSQDTTTAQKIINSAVALNYLGNLHYMSKSLVNMAQDIYNNNSTKLLEEPDPLINDSINATETIGKTDPLTNDA